jgi:hypothetical protein
MRKSLWIVYMIGLLLLIASLGCAGLFSGYGNITPDDEATRAFETFQINPDYHYYYSGSETYPSAFIGIHKKYKLEPNLWKKLEVTPKLYKDIITQMQFKAFNQLGMHQFGYAITDAKGDRIGIWYSIMSARTSVRMKDDATVILTTPDIDTYLKYENQGDR